jgi:hypothetical protein
MKRLILLAITLFFMWKESNAQLLLPSRNNDTIRASLLYSDTSSLVNTVNWMHGYEVIRYEWKDVTSPGNRGFSMKVLPVHVTYLDIDRKPLKEGILIWESKTTL